MHRFKLTRRMPIYNLTKAVLVRAEDELRTVAMKTSADGVAAELEIEHCVKDDEGEETFDTIHHLHGTLSKTTQSANVTAISGSAGFQVVLLLHKDNPFDNSVHIICDGENARGECHGIHGKLLQALSEFEQSPGVATSAAESKSFTIHVPSLELTRTGLLGLERYLVDAAAAHTRLSPSSVAKDLRVALRVEGKTEEKASSIAQLLEIDDPPPESFSEVSLKISSCGDLFGGCNYSAEITFSPTPSECNMVIECDGEGSKAAAKSSREELERWLKKHRNGNHRLHVGRGRKAVLVMLALYAGFGALLAFLEASASLGVILVGLAALAVTTATYASHVWPYIRIGDERGDQHFRAIQGRYQTISGTFLIFTVIVPVLIQMATSGP